MPVIIVRCVTPQPAPELRGPGRRMDAHVISLGASHLSLISHSTDVAGLIECAARAVTSPCRIRGFPKRPRK